MSDLVNKHTGLPPKGYTDLQWQEDLLKIRGQVSPSRFRDMKIETESVGHLELYHGMTQYQSYCKFINDILSNIRKGKTGYCFYIYQISELLRYEHDDLRAEWLPEDKCFKISLNR